MTGKMTFPNAESKIKELIMTNSTSFSTHPNLYFFLTLGYEKGKGIFVGLIDCLPLHWSQVEFLCCENSVSPGTQTRRYRGGYLKTKHSFSIKGTFMPIISSPDLSVLAEPDGVSVEAALASFCFRSSS